MTTVNENNNMQPTSDRIDSQAKNRSNSSVDDEIDVSVWFRTGQRKTGYIRGRTFDLKEVQYSAIDNNAILEGDILLGTLEEVEKFGEMVQSGAVPRGIGVTNRDKRWPKGIIPYVIDESISVERHEIIHRAMEHWREKTPIQFVERTSGNENKYPNYVRIQKQENGCFATLGMAKNEQIINLGDNCYEFGIIVHEIGHTVGLYHEQSRENRDQFVEVLKDNIEFKDEVGGGPSRDQPDGENDTYVINFAQEINDGDDIGEYDYDSIMHYPSTAFGRKVNGKTLTTIEPLEPNKEEKRKRMGQRKGLSQGDIAAVKYMYKDIVEPVPTPEPTPTPTPEPNPTPEPTQPTQETDIVSVYQYYADKPVWRYLYDKKQSEDFVRDGWKFDRIVFQAFGPKQAGTVPVYRFAAEGEPWRHMLSQKAEIDGWINEDVVFYAFEDEKPDIQDSSLAERLRPIYQYYAIDTEGRWRYQYSPKSDIKDGWQSEGPAFYALLPTNA